MTEATKWKAGDKVRDRAHLGGTVLQTWRNGVEARWNNGNTAWVAADILSRDGEDVNNAKG
jgi:hypothetical protein